MTRAEIEDALEEARDLLREFEGQAMELRSLVRGWTEKVCDLERQLEECEEPEEPEEEGTDDQG